VVVNSVEAILTSRYVDGVTNAVERSKSILSSNFAAMSNAQQVFGGAADQAFNRAVGALERWRAGLSRAQADTDSKFKMMSFAALSVGLAVAQMAISTGRAIASYLGARAREASEVLELKLAYEGLSAATGFQTDTLAKLKSATEGLVSSKVLLTNVNRVMSSGVKVTSDQYVKLTENVFKLSKAAGVEGPQAIAALTDALIKGNARGFQQIGLSMIQAKDNISQFADESGTKMNNAAKATAFYNELLQATSAAVLKLPSDFLSVADAVERIEKQWAALFNVLGEGILRSRVLQEVLVRVMGRLADVGARKEDVEAIAKATNNGVIAFLKLTAVGLGVIAIIAGIGGVAKGTLEAVFNGVPFLVGGMITVVSQFFVWLLNGFASLPGSVGRFFQDVANQVNVFAVRTKAATDQLGSKALNAFTGALSGFEAANGAATKVLNLAKSMEKLNGEVIRGTGTAGANAAATAQQSVNQKELNDQLSKYLALRSEISRRDQTGLAKAAGDFAETLRKIRELDLSAVADAENRKADLRILAGRRFLQEVSRINQEAADKQRDLDQQGVDLSRKLHEEWIQSEAENVTRLFETISGEAARREEQKWNALWDGVKAKRLADFDTLIQQGQNYLSLIDSTERSIKAGIVSREDGLRLEAEAFSAARARLEELRNQSLVNNLPPEQLQKLQDYERQVAEMQQRMRRITVEMFAELDAKFQGFFSTAADGWVNFWKDLASGQEGAGKKLLAVFVGWVGKLLVQWGVMLIQAGIGEIALATTLFGRLMGASLASGLKLLAIGAAIAAAGGVLQGAASNLAQTNQAGSAGNSFQNVPRPNNNNPVQVIRVGRSDDEGRPTNNRDLGTLKIDVPQGFIVKHVQDNIQGNGVLRTLIATA
jgi:hypothetical protein